MTKNFCDLCGKPAVDHPQRAFHARKIVRGTGGGFIEMMTYFAFEPADGHGRKDADLCANCAKELAEKALAGKAKKPS